ncbi:hypothetical protein Moror_4711 [Moniliophthora roreri MCA 2997]|uniref:DUF6535 domain-containing protein n=1 Tax=Moniliophthora roreri (strain MCA 2997) TaxID=1381753 RepID=V2YKN6_MONRO|nr:hypothetical protein Moror_4711 [Moniliophthora roreri MCA 2997]
MASEGQAEFPSSIRGLKDQDPAQIPLPPSPIPSHSDQISHDQNENSAGLPENQNLSPPATSQPVDAADNSQEKKKRPTVDESWEVLRRAVARHDDDMVKNYKEDIDTQLVFAGLFSAVVTAFLIESYQWLSEDPADATVALLMQISVQLNPSQSIPAERLPFEADSFSIRINCFWFLSLILSLTSALFGLLCKQWLREHQRDTQTRTPGEELALRQLRRDSFERWGVSSFLSALPILPEVALLLFFVGVLDLLWNRNRIPFVVCFVTVMVSTGLYFVTTVLPMLTVPGNQLLKIWNWDFNELSYQFICPYKSPQAWGVYYLSCKLFRLLSQYGRIESFLSKRAPSLWDHAMDLVTDWSSFDLRVVRQFDATPHPFPDSNDFNLKVYELRAFEWAVTMFQDSPSMIPHLQSVLGTIPTSVAMSVILDRWRYTMWENIPRSDVELRLRDQDAFLDLKYEVDYYIWNAPEPRMNDRSLHSLEALQLLFCHHYWLAIAKRPDMGEERISDRLYESIDSNHTRLQQSTNLRFVIPFPVVDALWTHEDPKVRKRSLRLLHYFEDAWRTHPGYDEDRHDDERLAFIVALTRHLNRRDRNSELLTSSRGQELIRFIHEQVISRRLYETNWNSDIPRRRTLILEWTEATRRAREIGNLPDDYFLPVPNHGEDPPPSLAHVADSSGIRYSVDSEHPPLNAEGENSGPGSDNNESGRDAGALSVAAQGDTGGGIEGNGADERV